MDQLYNYNQLYLLIPSSTICTLDGYYSMALWEFLVEIHHNWMGYSLERSLMLAKWFENGSSII